MARRSRRKSGGYIGRVVGFNVNVGFGSPAVNDRGDIPEMLCIICGLTKYQCPQKHDLEASVY
jgi:hypothetical protein